MQVEPTKSSYFTKLDFQKKLDEVSAEQNELLEAEYEILEETGGYP